VTDASARQVVKPKTTVEDVRVLVEQSKRGGLITALLACPLASAEYTGSTFRLLAALLISSLFVGVLRLVVARYVLRAGDRALELLSAYRLIVLLSALAWGVCVGATVYSGDLEIIVLAVTLSAGLAAGGTTSLVADPLLLRLYLGTLLAPLVVAVLLRGRLNAPWLSASIVAFGGYLIAHSRHLRASLLLARTNAVLLEQRADRLQAEGQRAEQALQGAERARGEAAQANRAKSAFLANMSHELRTPLTAIIGYAEQILRKEDDPGTQLEYVEIIRRNGAHLLELINDILDMSKIEAGKLTVAMHPFPLLPLLADLAHVMRPRAKEKQIEFNIRMGSRLPETVTTDLVRTRQVLFNLLSNAIKFTSRGDVLLRVYFDAADLLLTFEVIDTGPGLSREAQLRLFSPFIQEDDSTSRKHQGTGLGLFIARRCARLMGGDVVLHSALGAGCTFTFTVPLQPSDSSELVDTLAEPARVQSTAAARATLQVLAGARVLLAEDGADNQRLIIAILRREGATVDAVSDGVAAVAAAKRGTEGGPYDVVLMDMEMPTLDGYGATARLRKGGYRGPIVALTAHAMEMHRERSLAAGCDDHVVKPIHRATLIEAVRSRLDRGRSPTTDDASLTSTLEDDDLIRDLLPAFLATLSDWATQLEAASARGDYDALKRVAHQLRGAGGGYGYDRITDAAAALEIELARDERASTCAVEALVTLCRRTSRVARDLPTDALPTGRAD
jgi:signal transduction histidine kinase/DNA-binding response OmpR family regulator